MARMWRSIEQRDNIAMTIRPIIISVFSNSGRGLELSATFVDITVSLYFVFSAPDTNITRTALIRGTFSYCAQGDPIPCSVQNVETKDSVALRMFRFRQYVGAQQMAARVWACGPGLALYRLRTRTQHRGVEKARSAEGGQSGV